jgi:2'-5' RNA ligase
MRVRNPLYVMARPPPAVASLIAALPRNDPGRGPELLHVTLAKLFDLHRAPPDWLPATIAALGSFEGAAFPLAFDRIESRKAVTLCSRAPLPDARAFQASLIRHLLDRRAPLMLGTTPEPHLTINYRGDRQGSRKTEPIGWTVAEILLVESVVGKTTHIEHGRWPLKGVPARLAAQGDTRSSG